MRCDDPVGEDFAVVAPYTTVRPSASHTTVRPSASYTTV
jgi:hypothetical protein